VGDVTLPGNIRAPGLRRGSPALVTDSEGVRDTDSAAFQPASAALPQFESVGDGVLWNQAESRSSKIGVGSDPLGLAGSDC
jgi:hypothetical protein